MMHLNFHDVEEFSLSPIKERIQDGETFFSRKLRITYADYDGKTIKQDIALFANKRERLECLLKEGY